MFVLPPKKKKKNKKESENYMESWQIDGETVETVVDFIFLGSKITADGLQPWN